MQSRHASAGQEVIKQGAKGSTFYMVKLGAVEVIADGKKIATLKSGEYFGERSILTEDPTVASVVAVEPTELMCLDKASFEGLLGPLQKLIDREVARRDSQLLDAQRASPVSAAGPPLATPSSAHVRGFPSSA